MARKIGKVVFVGIAPLLLVAVGFAFLCSDLLCHLQRLLRRSAPPSPLPSPDPSSPAKVLPTPRNASIIIPNWNGKELLEKYLPSLIESCSAGDEIIVVDNGSTDDSANFVRQHFPQVRLLTLERNRGFGGGCNAGVQAARHDIVVLLNNDMRATSGFLPPLLQGFSDPGVFAVSAQIFFSDTHRRREETGLTAGWFEKGFLRVRHEADDRIGKLYPTFYAGGGSTAYDRRKFLELGGFDPLFEPFYLEDTDLSYQAWRRGWKVLYQPESQLYHEHRATIGRHYSPEAIRTFLHKNYVLMVWKNIHRWRWLLQHFFYLYGHLALCGLGRQTETRTSPRAFLRALRQLRPALVSRRRALLGAAIHEPAVFEHTRPAVFRDRFPSPAPLQETRTEDSSGPSPHFSSSRVTVVPRPLNILFVSPYSIYPPVHGGAVLMWEALRELSSRHNVYVLLFVDRPEELESNRSLEGLVRRVEALQRRPASSRPFGFRPHAEQVFQDPQFAAVLDKMVWLHDIDLIQFEYTQMAQYRLPLQRTPQCLFEHNVYFWAVQRELLCERVGIFRKAQQFLEWLRALRFEIPAVEKFDAIFTCHEEEKQLLESFLNRKNGRRPRLWSGMRTAIEVSSYPFPGGPRKPDSLLFAGNFQHEPNVRGLEYFCRQVLPRIRRRRPQTILTAVGAHAMPEIRRICEGEGIQFSGEVADIRDPLSRHAVFVCPILTGAGIRVKILEAFASGIPVVATPLGAEGLCATHETHLLLASSPEQFASQTLSLLENPDAAAAMAARARRLVEAVYDWPVVGKKLEEAYYQLIAERRTSSDSAA